MTVLPAREVPATSPGRPDRLVIVTDHDGHEYPVRWRYGRAEPWRCTACGPQARAECSHTFAAGLVLADSLLGLDRVPELHPEGEPQP